MFIGAFDIGGTKTIVGLLTESRIIESTTFPTDRSNPESHIRKCVGVLSSLMDANNVGKDELAGIGVTVPGIASDDGTLLHSAYPEWNGVNIRDAIKRISGHANVEIENDVNACALAESIYVRDLPYSNYLWVTVSTGIGGALVLDKSLYKGSSGAAGEIGHVKVEYESLYQCPSCGGFGCLEAHASGSAIGRMLKEESEKHPSLYKELEERNLSADASSCALLAEEGNCYAIRCFDRAADYLARGLGYAVNILNPEAIVLGGGVANSLDLMYNQILQGIGKYVHPNLLPVEIVRTRLGYMAGLMGASSLIVSKLQLKEGCYDT